MLTPIGELPSAGEFGHAYTLNILYTQPQGDPPTSLVMVLESPAGRIMKPPDAIDGSDPVKGITVNWTFAPQNAGTYRYHFEAMSSLGEDARYPADQKQELEFHSISILVQALIFIVGALIAVVALPTLVYAAVRAVHRGGDPAAAARAGLFVGVFAAFGLFCYLFAGIYHSLGVAAAGVVAIVVLIALFTRR